MKKLLIGTLVLASALVFSVPAMAEVNVGIRIPLPPLIVFATPPEVVVIPETYVYAVPDVDADIYFYNGWWWRPWEGRWYRSRHYDSGWVHYQRVPTFYGRIPSGWRDDYRDHRWGGRPWNHQRIPQQQLQRNWSSWEKNRHWEKQKTWGVQGLKPRTRSQQPSQAVRPKSQAKPQSREVQTPQPRPQSRSVNPKSEEEVKPKPSRPQSREVQQKHSQPQEREAPQQPKTRKGRPERGEEDKRDGK